VYRVATNACLDELRRKSRRPLATDDETLAVAPQVDTFADQVATRLEVEAALTQLSPDFRAAVVLRDFCQLDYDEIASVLDIPGGTVRSRIARARGQLATLLQSRNQPPSYDRPTLPE
jgi:RNA polymerase sigma-70 factor (ECF subfamily)